MSLPWYLSQSFLKPSWLSNQFSCLVVFLSMSFHMPFSVCLCKFSDSLELQPSNIYLISEQFFEGHMQPIEKFRDPYTS